MLGEMLARTNERESDYWFSQAAEQQQKQQTDGVNATVNLVPQHLIQRWLGHASPKTTAIYCDVCGPDERACATRMWREFARGHKAR